MKKQNKKKREKEIILMRGRGKNCQCSDCLVLYGGDCPFDNAEENKEPRLIAKKININV